jgi:hypothetical protein
LEIKESSAQTESSPQDHTAASDRIEVDAIDQVIVDQNIPEPATEN